MTSSNTLKKLVSFGAAMLLAVGGSLVAAEPAHATGGDTLTWTSNDPNAVFALSNSSTYVQTGLTNSMTLNAPSVTNNGCTISYWADWRNGGNFSNRSFPLSYYENADREYRAFWTCPAVLTTGPTIAVSGNTVTATPGVWSRGSVQGEWLLCGQTVSAGSNMNGSFNSNASQCQNLLSSSGGNTPVTTTSISLTSTYYTSNQPNNNIATFGGLKLVWIERTSSGVSGFANSASVTAGSNVVLDSSSPSSARPLSAEQAKNALKPVPAAVQPLVAGFLALNKPMASLGGKVALSAGDFTGLVSAKIAGKPLDFILGKTGQITMTVPQGEAGKTADLVLTFNTGSIILQDAIKYVAPVVVANVPARPISITSTSKAFSEEAVSEIRQAAFANVKNTAVACVAYSAADTSAAKAAAKSNAAKVCEIANKANSDLAITEVTVIVDKLKARTEGVGIKVYKADN